MSKGYKILHVEDDSEYHELFKMQMQRLNIKEGGRPLEFFNVSSLDDARKMFKCNDYDLIVSDYQVLKGNGLDFLKEVRKVDISIPIIFLTSQGDEQVARDAFVYGANDYFTKQIGLVSFEKLYNAIKFQIDLYEVRKREKEAKKKLYYNETLLINLFESISDLLFFKDIDGTYMMVNRAFEELTGMNKKQLIGLENRHIFSPKDARTLSMNDDEVISSGHAMTFEDRIELNGKAYFFETLKIPVKDEDNSMIGLMGISRDITKRKGIEESKRKSELLYQTLVENIPNCCLLLFDRALNILFFGGEGVKGIFGEEVDISNDRLWTTLDEDTSRYLLTHFRLALDGHKQTFEFEHCSHILEVYVIPIGDGDAADRLGMALIYDITDRKIIERELIGQRKEISEYAHTVSYNLKNQLITLNAYVQLVMEEDDDFMFYCKNLSKIVRKINNYITGQLKLTEAGRDVADTRDIDLNFIVDKVGRNFLADIEKGELPNVVGDPVNMEEVFNNLVSNALIHGKAKRITVYSVTDERWHRIFFEDDGIGIPEANIDKVFELGFSTDGGGFGLAIVKKIIEAHRGDIKVRSTQGKGTSFEILLPRAPDDAGYGKVCPEKREGAS